MFSEMVEQLARGERPDPVTLRGRMRAAITKKLALVQQPTTYWESDPKRNPRSDHLLWGAILLDDSELRDVVSGIIAMEQGARPGGSADQFEREAVRRLRALCPDLPG
ncbi:MAG: hypothetical protein H8E79_08190 [Desulfobulbaceae bacterium]|uniref:Uncharacterized protein n=1 Tax=Candidatus Desulfatifera sulfidica TaxID=2841691 RepID=A0A8J6N913_9BACT|nr:hypothetical protein [Candidatus Desulfatifera sulfidica]